VNFNIHRKIKSGTINEKLIFNDENVFALKIKDEIVYLFRNNKDQNVFFFMKNID